MSNKQPRLFVSDLTDRVYVSSAYKVTDDQKGHMTITGKKYDVTEEFHYIAKRLGYTKSERGDQRGEDEL